VLRATVLDGTADQEILHQVRRFSSPAFDRTLPAHDAQAVRYSMILPRTLDLSLRIDSKLLHPKYSLQFQALACEASRTQRGVGFALGAEARPTTRPLEAQRVQSSSACSCRPWHCCTQVKSTCTWPSRASSALCAWPAKPGRLFCRREPSSCAPVPRRFRHDQAKPLDSLDGPKH
jgi:hypothetical protein